MCVLTFLPKEFNNFILTNNRDESGTRPKALLPEVYLINSQWVTLPKDARAGGTWIATSADFTLCLLNGAYVNHVHKPPYRQSRGKVILDFFESCNLQKFTKNYQFEGIEPFTLIVLDTRKNLIMSEIRWDSEVVFLEEKNAAQAHIWSSATLYSPQVIAQREVWFAEWLSQYPEQNYTSAQALDFHKNAGNGDAENDLKMNRNGELFTQCITQINRVEGKSLMVFEDLCLEVDNSQTYHNLTNRFPLKTGIS